MPLNIIRNDITKVRADAIVNTANPQVAVGAGVDQQIYEAAGARALLAERAKIGPMKPGQAAVTPAFGLDAKYIIHTVGPAWRGGDFGERDAVASCYRQSLKLAEEYACESVAFPLISTGTYGFPKDEALRIAISEISAFLFTHEMAVYLVVYDRESFVISGKAFADIREYIQERDVRQDIQAFSYAAAPAPMASRDTAQIPRVGAAPPVVSEEEMPAGNVPSPRRRRRLRDVLSRRERDAAMEEEPAFCESTASFAEATSEEAETCEVGATAPAGALETDMAVPVTGASETDATTPMVGAPATDDAPEQERWTTETPIWAGDLEHVLSRQGETFQQMLFRLIDRRGMTDPQVYKKANIDRKLFSKIRSNERYVPSKRTVLALAVALELNMDETMDLLQRAGLALSPSNRFDLIVGYCIQHQIYNIFEINTYLFEYDEPLLVG